MSGIQEWEEDVEIGITCGNSFVGGRDWKVEGRR
jgi:hypothetical protein